MVKSYIQPVPESVDGLVRPPVSPDPDLFAVALGAYEASRRLFGLAAVRDLS